MWTLGLLVEDKVVDVSRVLSGREGTGREAY
jgi:hypothetical protein